MWVTFLQRTYLYNFNEYLHEFGKVLTDHFVTCSLRKMNTGDVQYAMVLDSKGNDHIGKLLYRDFSIQQGIDPLIAKQVVKMVKAGKTKVQVSIQGEKIRFSGKKRDQLQEIIAMMKEAGFKIPLQFNNFRD